MRIIHKKALLLLLALLFILTSVGCFGTERDIVQDGIEIVDDPPYKREVVERTESVLLSLMRYGYLSISSFDEISTTVDGRISAYAERISDLATEHPISESRYIDVVDALERNGRAVIDELLSLTDADEPTLEHTRSLYLVLSGAFGADRAASMLYDACLVIYDMKYEVAMERFDTYGYPWYKEEAEALLAEKQEFLDGIGREDFSALVRFATAFAEVAFYGIDESADVFFDSEILLLLQSLDVDDIGIDESGYVLLMSYIAPKDAPEDAATLYEKARYEFYNSGDSARVASVMDDAVTMMSRVLRSLTADDIRAIRERDHGALVTSVFSRFTEEDWELFSRVTDLELSNDIYSHLSETKYGDEYTSYLASLRSVELDELRSAVGTDGFYEYLRDYLIGICPAVAYEVSK